MGKKRSNNTNKAEEEVASPAVVETPVEAVETQEEETVASQEETVAAPVDVAAEPFVVVPSEHEAPVETIPVDSASSSPASPTPAPLGGSTSSEVFAKAQKTVDAAVGVAKEAAMATATQISAHLGEEKTQKVIDYANYAKNEVMEVVDFARDAVEESASKARATATQRVSEAKELVNEKKELVTATINEKKELVTATINEKKELANARISDAKAKAVEVKEKTVERVAETVETVKQQAIEKSEKPRQKAAEVNTWLKGEVAETPLEHTTCEVAAFVIGTSLRIGNGMLGAVGLDQKTANVVNAVRARVTDVAQNTPVIQKTHSFASGYWPYRLVARMASSIDGGVMERVSGHAPAAAAVTVATSTEEEPAAPVAAE